MSPDDRQEREDVAWLLARSRDETVGHPDAARAAAYLRLEAALAALPRPRGPRGWQGRVVSAIDARARVRRWGRYAGPLAAAAILLATWGAGRAKRPVEGGLELLAIESIRRPAGGACRGGPGATSRDDAGGHSQGASRASGAGVRGRDGDAVAADPTRASLGDTVELGGWLRGPGELRVYRDGGELVLRCPGGEGCAASFDGRRRGVRGSLTPAAPGRYRAVLLAGASLPGPGPAEREGEGLQAAMRAGARVVGSLLIEVR